MAIPKFKPLADVSEGTKKTLKPILGVVIALLLGAFGLTATGNDWNLNSILSGSSVKDSKIATDSSGNLLFDKLGNVVTDSTKGKTADEYNCSDFDTQPEAQAFFTKLGGVKYDTNRLDGNKDGVACQELPKTKK